MERFRKLVFLIFAGAYLGVAPLTVLYALGYIFNPVEQTLSPTGLVSLATEPASATVWVNETPVNDKTPVILRNLKPGTYRLKITFPRRYPWEKMVEVKENVALRFEDIFLFPSKLKVEEMSPFPLERIWSVPEARYWVVQQGKNAAGLFVFDLAEETFQPIFTNPRTQKAKVLNVSLHPVWDRAVVTLERKGGPHHFFVKFGDRPRLVNLTRLFQESFRDFQWSRDFRESLFYLKGNVLRRLDLERNLLYPSLAREVQAFTLYERRLFVLDRERRFLELTDKGRLRELHLHDAEKARLIFGEESEKFRTVVFIPANPLLFIPKEAVALFLSDSGRLVSNQLPYFLDEGVEEFQIGRRHPRVVYRKGNELWGIDFEEEEETSFFEIGPTSGQIRRGSEAPAEILWFHDDRYLLFLEGDRLFAQEFETDSQPIELLKVSRDTPDLAFDARRGYLYFAHPESRRLSRVRLTEEFYESTRLLLQPQPSESR